MNICKNTFELKKQDITAVLHQGKNRWDIDDVEQFNTSRDVDTSCGQQHFICGPIRIESILLMKNHPKFADSDNLGLEICICGKKRSIPCYVSEFQASNDSFKLVIQNRVKSIFKGYRRSAWIETQHIREEYSNGVRQYFDPIILSEMARQARQMSDSYDDYCA